MIAVLATPMASPAAAEFAAEVYRDDSIIVHAGLQASSSQVVHFGDVLVLIIAVSYDPNNVSIQDPGAALFTTAWTTDKGAQLVDWRVRHDRISGSRLKRMHVAYRFQILGCPDNDSPTCPGNRNYALPEFVLAFENLTTNGDSARSIRFRPWPETLAVSTTLQSDDEGQLLRFEKYFPTGGYPDPLVGEDDISMSFLTAGITFALLIGGLLMWPFRSGNQKKAAADLPRWLIQLQNLDEADTTDEARFLDALRRCLVCYCNDQLQLDPFVWLDLAEPGDDSGDDRTHSDLRLLFIDLLHNPAGQGEELRKRLDAIISP